MTVLTRLIARCYGLPRARTHNVVVERGLLVRMPDGVDLLADHYYARADGWRDPVVLIRSPYGRGSIWGILARLTAERGYQVLLQSVRGTFGSGGKFEPFAYEARDGLATLVWLKDREWFSGRVAMTGPSYLGYVQWAVATNSPPEYFRAMVPSITASEFRSLHYPGESFALASVLYWVYLIHNQEKLGLLRGIVSQMRTESALRPAFDHVPLGEADQITTGTRVGFYQEVLANCQPGAPYWAARDYSTKVGDVDVPVHLVGGWYDLFLPQQLADYGALRRSGKSTPFLTIGPWTHTSLACMLTGMKESYAWFDAYLRGDVSKLRKDPVMVYVTGTKRWLGLPEWPPPGMRISRWYLRENRKLDRDAPHPDSPPDVYDYDPKTPTPSIGGVFLGNNAGPRDNRELEKRPDVVTYTSDPVAEDYTIIGPVSVDLWVKSSLENTDFFARICDVTPRGSSRNVCDGVRRLRPMDFSEIRIPDGVVRVAFDLWPTAHVFLGGHRLRLQVSSGSHPRVARNLGGDEPLASATTFRVAHQEIFHDAGHQSVVLLPECPHIDPSL